MYETITKKIVLDFLPLSLALDVLERHPGVATLFMPRSKTIIKGSTCYGDRSDIVGQGAALEVPDAFRENPKVEL